MAAEEDAPLRLRGVDEVGAPAASSAAACRKFSFFFPHHAAVSLWLSALRWRQAVQSLLRQDQLPVNEVDVAPRPA